MNLVNHFLVPTQKHPNPYFHDALVYLCGNHAGGAWGFVVNRPKPLSVGAFLLQSHLHASHLMNTPTHAGGLDKDNAGFVLHTGSPNYRLSLGISENICLTTSKDILPALADGRAARAYLLLLGLCRWRQVDIWHELRHGYWLSCPANAGILFDPDDDQKLAKVYNAMGLMAVRPLVGNA